ANCPVSRTYERWVSRNSRVCASCGNEAWISWSRLRADTEAGHTLIEPELHSCEVPCCCQPRERDEMRGSRNGWWIGAVVGRTQIAHALSYARRCPSQDPR